MAGLSDAQFNCPPAPGWSMAFMGTVGYMSPEQASGKAEDLGVLARRVSYLRTLSAQSDPEGDERVRCTRVS